MRHHRIIRALAIVVGTVVLAAAALYLWLFFWDPPSVKYSKSSVSRLVFVSGNRVLLANSFHEVFASDPNGANWQRIAKNVPGLTIANGSQLWGCRGWPGIHEGPSATLWFSPDQGRTWTKWNLDLPSADGYLPEVQRQLPAAFINEATDAPALLMYNFQVAHPLPNTTFENWRLVGKPPPSAKSSVRRGWMGAGLIHGNVIYVAASGQLHMSTDGAQTWSTLEVHDFQDARISCLHSVCYALLSQLGSDWSGLMTTPFGSNEWHQLGSLEVPEIRRALETQVKSHGSIGSFGATAMLPFAEGAYVAGIINAGGASWGAVLIVTKDGQLRSLPGAINAGLWELAAAPDGRIWTGGIGAYRQTSNGWIRTWSSAQ